MKLTSASILFALLVLGGIGYYLSSNNQELVLTGNLPEPEKLKVAIAESIEIPFEESDTVIYDSHIGICGNSHEDLINRYYEPDLSEPPFSKILTENYEGTMWFTGDDFIHRMDSVCGNSNETYRDCVFKNKISFMLVGRTMSNTSVEIYERYFLNDKAELITKLFKFKKGKWTYRMTDSEYFYY